VAADVSSGSKKTKAARKQRGSKNLMNKKQKKMSNAVMGALEDDDTTKVFGRVIKILGGIHLQVYLTDGTQYTAVMRGLLRKRGHTPIEAGSVVLLERPDPTIRSEQVLDVCAVLDHDAAKLLVKKKTIPQWFMTLGVGEVPPEGGEDEYDYDYFEDPIEIDEEGNIVVSGSVMAQAIARRFCYTLKSTEGGGAEPECEIELTEEDIDGI
jgi:translation initiation factor IF-1